MLSQYPGDHVQKSVSELGVRPGQAQSGLDVLVGKSSLVVLPGSRRPDGDVVWLEGRRSDQLPFAPIPDWLLQLMIAASSPKRPAAEAAGSASRSSATDEVREAITQVLREMAPEAARDNWLGDENELRRLLDALRVLDRVMARIRKRERPPATRHGVLIDIRWRDFWLRIGRALHSYFGGGEQGLQLWIAITAGNSELGLVGCPECFDEVELRAEYASLGNHTKPMQQIGTLIDFAIAVGFNAKRSDYGLPALPAKQLEIRGRQEGLGRGAGLSGTAAARQRPALPSLSDHPGSWHHGGKGG